MQVTKLDQLACSAQKNQPVRVQPSNLRYEKISTRLACNFDCLKWVLQLQCQRICYRSEIHNRANPTL